MFFDPRVERVLGEFTRVDADAREVHPKGARALPDDLRIVDTGSELRAEKTPGLTGAKRYACELAMKMFKREKNDLLPQVVDVITAGDFYDLSAGAQIIFT